MLGHIGRFAVFTKKRTHTSLRLSPVPPRAGLHSPLHFLLLLLCMCVCAEFNFGDISARKCILALEMGQPRALPHPKVVSIFLREPLPPRPLGNFSADVGLGGWVVPPPPLGDTTPAILAGTKRTENSFGIIWPSPRQLRVKNTLRVGHRGPVGRKTTQKPPQNTKKWKKIVKKRLFSRFGHFGQNSDFSRKKSKTGIFFDITKPPLAQIYPKSGL